jgi:hypothetical protein
MKYLLAVCVVFCIGLSISSSGCSSNKRSESGSASAWTDKEKERDLQDLVLGYHTYMDRQLKPPTQPADFSKVIPGAPSIDALNKGLIVFIFNAGWKDMPDSVTKTILAYEAKPDPNGMRWVGFAGGTVRKVTEQDFEKMPKAGKK